MVGKRVGGLFGMPHLRLWTLALITCLIGVSACTGGAAPVSIESDTPTPFPTETPIATATIIWFPATATPTPVPTQALAQPSATAELQVGKLLLSDDFSDTTLWQTRQSSQGTVAYGINELSLANPGVKTTLTSLRTDLALTDFYLEIDVSATLCSGSDNYGLLVRAQGTQDFYRWILTCEGQERLERVIKGESSVMQNWMGSTSRPGDNRLGVLASGREMSFYIDGILQFTVRDPIFPNGELGVFTRSSGEKALTVSFSNLNIYDGLDVTTDGQ